MATRPALAVSFDVGQTLLELDTAMLARRLGERGVETTRERCDVAVAEGFRAYDAAVRASAGHPWKSLMRTAVEVAGAPADRAGELVEWLFAEQQTKNLWRRPVAGMLEIVRELRAAGVPRVIVSNSEGRLAELLAELEHLDLFDAVADSGKLGFEKPDPRIFAWAADRIGVPLDRIVHVGDSLAADVTGALRAGLFAVWFPGDPASAPPGVPVARDAIELRAVLRELGLPL